MAGNRNSGGNKSEKPFRDMLALAIHDAKQEKGKLRKIADKLVSEAMKGNIQAMKEVADRLDGKAAQSLTVGGDSDNPVQIRTIERRIVDPAKSGN